MCVSMCICMRIRMRMCKHVCMHAYMYACMHVCMHARMHVCIWINIFIYVCIYVCAPVGAHVRANACLSQYINVGSRACVSALASEKKQTIKLKRQILASPSGRPRGDHLGRPTYMKSMLQSRTSFRKIRRIIVKGCPLFQPVTIKT